MMTLDDLITQLAALRAAGMPGTTPVARYSYSSILRLEADDLKVRAVSKPDIESGRRLVRAVSRKGVDVITIG